MTRSDTTAGGRDDLTVELAATAARLIAEDGCDYGTAKRKAVQIVLGDSSSARRRLPDNDLVESELRRYLQTFGGEGHAARIRGLRAVALRLMEYLAPFSPHLVGAVLNGTATEHSALHLHLFTDSAKDLEIFLLNEGIRFSVEEAPEPAGALECIHLQVPRRLLPAGAEAPAAALVVLPTDALRVASRFRSTDPSLTPIERSGRAGLAALRSLVTGVDSR